MDEVLKTIFSFLSQFGTVYYENSIPIGAKKPYLTYGFNLNEWDSTSLLTVNIYSQSTSFNEVTGIADRILKEVGFGKILPMSNKTYCVLYKGSPAMQIIGTDDLNFKQAYLTFSVMVEKA